MVNQQLSLQLDSLQFTWTSRWFTKTLTSILMTSERLTVKVMKPIEETIKSKIVIYES